MNTWHPALASDFFEEKSYGIATGTITREQSLSDIQGLSGVLGVSQVPTLTDFCAVYICLEGECEISLDMERYVLRKNDMCIIFPNIIIHALRRSEDHHGYGMAARMNFMDHLKLPSWINTYLYIHENPCITLPSSYLVKILDICYLIRCNAEQSHHPFHAEILDNLLSILCYEIVPLYDQGSVVKREAASRQDAIVQKFIVSVAHNFREKKSIASYAEEQFITPKHFASVVKKKIGLSPNQWITNVVIREAKKLLTNTELSIQEIALELNFPNPSFFGQYFKKATGLTPNRFRKQSGIFLNIE